MIALFGTLAALVLLPLGLLFLLKTNAGIMFLAACAGLVLLESLDPTVVMTAGSFLPGEGETYIRLIVIFLSVGFAALMFRNTVAKAQLAIHALLLIFLGVFLWVVLPGATGVSFLSELSKQPIWQDANEYRTLIVAGGFSLSLLAILLAKPAKHEKGKHH